MQYLESKTRSSERLVMMTSEDRHGAVWSENLAIMNSDYSAITGMFSCILILDDGHASKLDRPSFI